MPNYQNGKIYELVDLTTNNKYYGSTVQDLKMRKSGHVKKYKGYLNNKKNFYTTSFEIIKNNNYEIYLVENFPCNSKSELEAREGYYIRNNKCVNKYIPGIIDKKEYMKNYNKLYKIKEKGKQYRIDNKEKIKEYKKQLYHYKNSWGGDPRNNNNLLKINLDIFK